MPTEMGKAAKAAEQAAIDDLIERQTRVVVASFDRANAYTNAIILAGYAAFFGLWQITQPLVSPKLSLYAALLISISAVTFVVFEIYKSFQVSRSIFRLNNILLDPDRKNDLLVLGKAFERHDQEQRRAQTLHVSIWYVTFSISVITGISGAGILMASFILGLFD